MNAPSIDIVDLLIAEGSLALLFGDNLHIGKQPAEPDICTTIYDTGGTPVSDLAKSVYEQKNIQIKVRHISYVLGWALLQSISDYLNLITNRTINGTFYTGIFVVNGPEHLDYDEKNRIIFIINLEIQRRT